MSTSFHPQIVGQMEQATYSRGQIFHTVVRHDQKDSVNHVNLTKFAINTSMSETTKYTPFKLSGGYMPSMIKEICTNQAIPKGIRTFAEQALQNLADTHNMIIKLHVFQTSQANKCRGMEPTGDIVYLSMKNLNLPRKWTKKLCLKFVGPYKVLCASPEMSNYILELPKALQKHRIIPTFHVSLLQPYHPSDNAMFPNWVHSEPYNFGAPDDQEWFVDKILGH
jgi:hypothetical protein